MRRANCVQVSGVKTGGRRGSTRNIVFLLGYPRLTCLARLAGVYRSAAAHDMRVRIVENAYSRTDLREIIRFWNPVGLIASCGYGSGVCDIRRLTDLPVVYYDGTCGKGRSAAVQSDSRQIGRLAASELLKSDFRHAAFVPYFTNLFWSQARGRAFTKAMEAAGVSVRCFHPAAGLSQYARLTALGEWLASLPKPFGIFAANDLVAEEVEIAAERLNLRIPRDYVLVGVDNQEQLCINMPVPLTSIQMDFEQGGFLAAEKLAGLIRGTCPVGETFFYPVLKTVRRMSTRIDSTPVGALVERLSAFIRENVESGVSVERVVKESGYSRRQTEKLFRIGTGKSILDAIHDAVYDRACVLAKDPRHPISVVADMLGGVSRSQLDRIFVSRTGHTLRGWLTRT